MMTSLRSHASEVAKEQVAWTQSTSRGVLEASGPQRLAEAEHNLLNAQADLESKRSYEKTIVERGLTEEASSARIAVARAEAEVLRLLGGGGLG